GVGLGSAVGGGDGVGGAIGVGDGVGDAVGGVPGPDAAGVGGEGVGDERAKISEGHAVRLRIAGGVGNGQGVRVRRVVADRADGNGYGECRGGCAGGKGGGGPEGSHHFLSRCPV